MPIADYSTTPASNTTINGINIAEGCNPSGINDAIRQMMADIKTDAVTLTGTQTLTNKILTSPYVIGTLGIGTGGVATQAFEVWGATNTRIFVKETGSGNLAQVIASVNDVSFGSYTTTAVRFVMSDVERGRIDTGGRLLWNVTTAFDASGTLNIQSSTATLSLRHSSSAGGKYRRVSPDGNNSLVIVDQGAVGVFLGDGSTSWGTTSDERLKTNITVIPDALNKALAIRGVTYRMIGDPEGTFRAGVIAQDVQAVLPEAVCNAPKKEGDDTQYLGVQYTNLIPLLFAAIKELEARVAQLEGA